MTVWGWVRQREGSAGARGKRWCTWQEVGVGGGAHTSARWARTLRALVRAPPGVQMRMPAGGVMGEMGMMRVMRVMRVMRDDA